MNDANTPKPLSLGKFKPLIPDTSLARICAAALPGKCTIEQIAEKARLRPDQVAHRLRYGLGVAHGPKSKIAIWPLQSTPDRHAGCIGASSTSTRGWERG